MLIEEINKTITAIEENAWDLGCLVDKLCSENEQLKNTINELNESIEFLLKEKEDNDTAYDNGKRDGKKELIETIEKYFDLKEKGEINAK